MTKFMNFIRDEDGAVTLDWVALTAGVVLLGIAVIAALEAPVQGVIDSISTDLNDATNQSFL